MSLTRTASRGAQLLRWRRERLTLATACRKDHRFELVWNAAVHDGAILVSIHMCLLTLMWTAPTHAANLGTRQHPSGVSIKDLPKGLHIRFTHQIHKGISQVRFGPEIYGKVQKVIVALETFLVHHGTDHGPCVVVWKVS
eukprot:Skav200397  [mRNA]  locus=scaffold1919:187549:201576:+ [translate_table: standard]